MTGTETAPAITREVLLDRWDSVMDWTRTGGDASPEYTALVDALAVVVSRVSGQEETAGGYGAVDELVDRLAELTADVVLAQGIAR